MRIIKINVKVFYSNKENNARNHDFNKMTNITNGRLQNITNMLFGTTLECIFFLSKMFNLFMCVCTCVTVYTCVHVEARRGC